MRIQRCFIIFIAGVIVSVLSFGVVSASTTNASISHSYHTSNNIISGSLVSLDSHKSNYIELANINNSSRLIGVAVDTNSALLALDPTSATTQVAINGTVSTLVSTVNGDISVGDQISTSPFNGVGMKALPGSHVIGIAQGAMNAYTKNITTENVTDKNGKNNTIVVGYVKVNIAVGVSTNGSSGIFGELQKIAQSITGHNVSTLRVVLFLVVALFTVVSLIVLIYASIHGSIIAIGRNPLAKFSIFRSLGSTLAIALLTAALACVAIYFLLR